MVNQRVVSTKELIRCATWIALSLLLLLLSTAFPTARFGIVAVAGLFTGIATRFNSVKLGALVYLGTSLISAFIVPSKSAVLLYIVFFGVYPCLKVWLEHSKSRPLQWLGKLLFFYLSFYIIQVVLHTLIFLKMPLISSGWLFVLSHLCFLIYDFGLDKLDDIYQNRLYLLLKK